MVLITLKIGRHSYDITEDDCFMDNGNCVQLITQSKEYAGWGRWANPVLSKRAIKEISKLDRVKHVDSDSYGHSVSVFTLQAR